MNLHRTWIVVAGLLLVPMPSPAQNPKAETKRDLGKIDFTQQETPRKPLPGWIRTGKDGKPILIDQGKNDPRLAGYFTPEGIKLEVAADIPTVASPVGMTFGDDGSLFVIEWTPGRISETTETFTYRDKTTRTFPTVKKPVKDVVKMVRGKGTGSFDEAKVIVEDEFPSSILVHDGWLYLSGRGTVRRWKLADLVDREADQPQPKAEVIVQGFGGTFPQQVSGLSIGNDGLLWITAGEGDHHVEGSDGSRATVLRTGGIFRCRPDGSKIQVFSIGWCNPYRDVAFDAAFNAFHVDNDIEDGGKFTGCRLIHVAEESDFGWRLAPGASSRRPDPVRAAVAGELPGKLPPLARTGRGAPAGLMIYNETRFPAQYRGLLYYPDASRRLVRAYKLAPFNSTFVVASEFDFLQSDDPLFRPSQMVAGPDGAMYVCDTRGGSTIPGAASEAGKQGRILRLTWTGTEDDPAIAPRSMDSWSDLGKMLPPDLLKALDRPDFSDRLRAQQHLARIGGKGIRDKLLDLVAEPKNSARSRIAALGALQQMWDDEVKNEFLAQLYAGEPEIRKLAADGLALHSKSGDGEVDNTLLQVMGDQDLAARRAIILAMGKIGGPRAADSLVNNFRAFKEDDPFLYDALLRGLERLGKPGIDKLIELALSGVDKDFERVVEAFRMMRSRDAVDAIPNLLSYPHLTIPQRVNLIRSYGNYTFEPPASLEPLLGYLDRNKDETAQVKLAALELLTTPGISRTGKAELLAVELLDLKAPAFRLAVIQAVEIGRLAKAAPRLAALLREAAAVSAAGRDLAGERRAILRALAVLGDAAAVPVLEETLAAGPAEDRAATLGTLAALDPAAAQKAAEKWLAEKDQVLVTEAILVLGTRPEGAKLAAEQFIAGKLPRAVLPLIDDALRRHAPRVPDLAKLRTELLKGTLQVPTDKLGLERIETLVKEKGNPQRGKALFLDTRTLACVACHRLEGVGGNVGPDLTGIGESYSVPGLVGAILDPGKAIRHGWQAWTVAAKSGHVQTGLKLAQTDEELVLRNAAGRDIRIPARDIAAAAPSDHSLMPETAAALLSMDQFIDLLAFLKDRAAQESLRGVAREFWIIGPFNDPVPAIEEKPDPAQKLPGPREGDEFSWQVRHVAANGQLHLPGAFQGGKAVGYAVTYVYSPLPQKAELFLGGSQRLKAWVNSHVVREIEKPLLPGELDRCTVTLAEGWNALLLRVHPRENAGLMVRIAAPVRLTISPRP